VTQSTGILSTLGLGLQVNRVHWDSIFRYIEYTGTQSTRISSLLLGSDRLIPLRPMAIWECHGKDLSRSLFNQFNLSCDKTFLRGVLLLVSFYIKPFRFFMLSSKIELGC